MNLLLTEYRKIAPYRTFWFIIGIYVLLFLFLTYGSSTIMVNGQKLGNNMYQFPIIWSRLAYIGSFFNIIMSLLIIVLVSDEYSFRTFRQQVIDGLSRAELILAKIYVSLSLATFCTIFLVVLGFVFGMLNSSDRNASTILSGMDAIPYFFVHAFAYNAIALLFAILIRKSGLAIIAFLAYTKIVEPLVHFMLPDHIDKYFPMKVIGSLTPTPGQEMIDQLTASPTDLLLPQWAVWPALVYIALFVAASYLVLKMRDL